MIHRLHIRAHIRALTALAVAAATALIPLATQAQSRSASSGVNVGVNVVAGTLQLSTERATLPAGVSTISWQLGSAGWRFEANSLDFGDAAAAFSCRVFNDGAGISCNRSTSAPKGELPYRIRLSNGGPLMLPPQPNVYISLE